MDAIIKFNFCSLWIVSLGTVLVRQTILVRISLDLLGEPTLMLWSRP
jgi:hypothetical protein